jgi:shikimate kinase
MRVVFIGFMGSGKSTVGRIVADALSLPLFETDELVVRASGVGSIREIFDTRGEEWFRDLERRVCEDLSSITHGVIATGGGVVTREATIRALIAVPGVVVFLDVPFDVVAHRVGGDPSRPLFTSLERARALYESRLPLYRQYAHLTCSVESSTAKEVAAETLRLLSRPGCTSD